jgi:hypothetical protein
MSGSNQAEALPHHDQCVDCNDARAALKYQYGIEIKLIDPDFL